MSPRRPDPKALLEREHNGTGREAVYGGPAGRTPAPASLSYEERHKRVTFHCPLDLLEALDAEVSSSGRKKNTVIVEALRAHLKKR